MPEGVRRSRRLMALIGLPLVLSSCLGVEATTSILVRKLAVSLAFGGPPSSTQLAPQQAGEGPSLGVAVPTLQLSGELPIGSFTLPSPAAAFCPDQEFLFPRLSADPDLTAQPRAGAYLFRYQGTEVFTLAGLPPVSVKLPTIFTQRDIQPPAPPAPADPTNPGAYVFAESAGFGLALLDPKLVASFEGRPSSTDLAPPPPGHPGAGPLPSPAPTSASTNAGASVDGVYLTRLKFTAGTVVTAGPVPKQPPPTFDFTSAIGVQIFQVPASPGLTWSSTATDPTTQATIGFNATVASLQGGKERINACGEQVDTYRVDGTLTLSSPQGIAVTDQVTFWVVPQYGGWLASEHHKLTKAVFGAEDFSNTDVTYTLSKVDPGPLPAGGG
ncbi:MAG: LolA-like protein [Candidatus Dormibacteria bacterium]